MGASAFPRNKCGHTWVTGTKCAGAVYERYDRYGIYAGKMCDAHYRASGLEEWVFDPDYAGEALEPEDY
jgi:hypothetical protein